MTEQLEKSKLDANTLFWNRVQLIAVLVVFLAPIAGAFLYKPTKFNNYGDLYTPAPEITPLQIEGKDGVTEFARYKSEDLWAFLVIANGQCTEECEKSVLNARQLRAMQGKHLERLRTVVIYAGMDDEKAKDLAAKYQPLDLYKAKTDDLSNWEKQFQVASDTQDEQKSRFYVVDSKGLLMISYPSDADYKLVNKDLKRLLKARR
ncbi:MAG: hypothetical protein MK188_12830 [Gammaproteobacteria bacterium]|nr:hypothetical protein [Gammaproteobacteria bacterium]